MKPQQIIVGRDATEQDINAMEHCQKMGILKIIGYEDQYLTEKEFKEMYPEFAHTWDWDEHPLDYDGFCACLDCRLASQI